MFIKKMRTDMSEEYEWTGHPHESTIDESDYL